MKHSCGTGMRAGINGLDTAAGLYCVTTWKCGNDKWMGSDAVVPRFFLYTQSLAPSAAPLMCSDMSAPWIARDDTSSKVCTSVLAKTNQSSTRVYNLSPVSLPESLLDEVASSRPIRHRSDGTRNLPRSHLTETMARGRVNRQPCVLHGKIALSLLTFRAGPLRQRLLLPQGIPAPQLPAHPRIAPVQRCLDDVFVLRVRVHLLFAHPHDGRRPLDERTSIHLRVVRATVLARHPIVPNKTYRTDRLKHRPQGHAAFPAPGKLHAATPAERPADQRCSRSHQRGRPVSRTGRESAGFESRIPGRCGRNGTLSATRNTI